MNVFFESRGHVYGLCSSNRLLLLSVEEGVDGRVEDAVPRLDSRSRTNILAMRCLARYSDSWLPKNELFNNGG